MKDNEDVRAKESQGQQSRWRGCFFTNWKLHKSTPHKNVKLIPHFSQVIPIDLTGSSRVPQILTCPWIFISMLTTLTNQFAS